MTDDTDAIRCAKRAIYARKITKHRGGAIKFKGDSQKGHATPFSNEVIGKIIDVVRGELGSSVKSGWSEIMRKVGVKR